MTTEFGVGQHIGDYEILSILGMGGMGKVYKVRNVIADRVEAMKILLPDLSSNQSLADRFLREIRLLATLNHPHIAALRTALTYQNQLVMVMEFVEGETLANRLARAPLSTAEVVNYADQILSALSYAHKQNIIHRDIKPANMMLTPAGVVKLMDFGIARSSKDGTLTSTGTTLGSLNYMPPEQVRGEAADARSDIYSFGVSLYEMLTGKLPFHSDSQYSLMTAHLNETPPAPVTLRGDLPPALSEIIMMAIAKDPNNRFQSADAFRAALSSVPVGELPRADTTLPLTPTPASTATGATTLMDTPLTPRVAPTPTPARTPTPAPVATPAPPLPTVPQAAPQPPAAAPPPPTARPSSSRGVWLAIGALLGVGVIIAAGMYIPRHFGTHADPNQSVFSPNSSQGTTPPAAPNAAATNQTAANTTDASKPGSDIVNIQSDQGSLKVDANGNVSVNSPQGSMKVDAKTGSVKMIGKNGENLAVRGGNPAPARADAPQAPTAPAPPPGPSPEEIAKAEDAADKLNIRAATVQNSLETLRHQQQAAGYNLRADISASYDRMQAYLSKGNAALQAQDLKTAQKYFDQAEGELGKLEKFLGH
ncbi:MAG TPA: serine/threonine-protein kinase [Candidatus Saccharimonadales bacterium]|nr:serine/threonine-protein kinase [Candidatus Saccharimonadales bacterium]